MTVFWLLCFQYLTIENRSKNTLMSLHFMVRLIHVWFCKYSTTFGEAGGGRVGVVTNVVVYESIRKGQKKLCFAYLTDNPLSEKFSRWILANLSSFHTKRYYRKARLLQKNLLLKIIKYTHHPKKTTLSLLKQHYTVLECYNAYLDKEKQLELFITMIAVEKSVRSKSWFRGFHFLGFP